MTKHLLQGRGSKVAQCLEHVWAMLRALIVDLPPAVIVIGGVVSLYHEGDLLIPF